MTYGITNFDTIRIAIKDNKLDSLDVWLGKKDKVDVYTNQDIYKTVPKARKKYLKAIIKYDGPILAPINKDDVTISTQFDKLLAFRVLLNPKL